jgi:hypothetical protein
MGDAFGVFEICAGWHFQPDVVSDIADWAPRRSSEDEIATLTNMGNANPLVTVMAAEDDVKLMTPFNDAPLTTWCLQ